MTVTTIKINIINENDDIIDNERELAIEEILRLVKNGNFNGYNSCDHDESGNNFTKFEFETHIE